MVSRQHFGEDTVGFLEEIRQTLQRMVPARWRRHTPQIPLYSEIPELSDVEFVPINPTSPAGTPARCVVTGQKLPVGQLLYQCQNCGLMFSREGWRFLEEVDKGQCCGCHTQNSIKPYLPRT